MLPTRPPSKPLGKDAMPDPSIEPPGPCWRPGRRSMSDCHATVQLNHYMYYTRSPNRFSRCFAKVTIGYNITLSEWVGRRRGGRGVPGHGRGLGDLLRRADYLHRRAPPGPGPGPGPGCPGLLVRSEMATGRHCHFDRKWQQWQQDHCVNPYGVTANGSQWQPMTVWNDSVTLGYRSLTLTV
jgi:hypothetical protein